MTYDKQLFGRPTNKRMLKLAAGNCKSSEGATDADVDNLAEGRLPETQVQKCLYACLQKQFGISDGKKFSKQGFLKRSNVLVGSGDANKRKAQEIADECDGTANDDRCQLGADIAKCIRDGLIKRNRHSKDSKIDC
ncbi:Odorant-binding protein 56e [Culex quinquefasciatus]|uniref:Odorant-binding protein 56e n=1 Tax=Culex quinquefasciatus TaxID=7176 RepID=B0WLZ9_CULQU|nr:Odorant-binding protein 56e [Culex quinquefasciatus]|eukprot:XP_001849733.1 Odorant-binding protein 56e [Culex quinquefasciatus]